MNKLNYPASSPVNTVSLSAAQVADKTIQRLTAECAKKPQSASGETVGSTGAALLGGAIDTCASMHKTDQTANVSISPSDRAETLETNQAESDGRSVISPELPVEAYSEVVLLDNILQELGVVPLAGNGVHSWLFKAARILHRYYNAHTIAIILQHLTQNCGRPVPPREIQDAIRNSSPWMVHSWQTGMPRQSAWPERQLHRIQTILTKYKGVAELKESSPDKNMDSVSSDDIIDRLFPGNPLLCCAAHVHQFATKSREKWRGELNTLQFIVPNPMSAILGHTLDGRPSARTLSNTGPRRFLVVECDFKETDSEVNPTNDAELFQTARNQDMDAIDIGACVLLELARYAPLVMAVYSGGKSVHGWFSVEGGSEENIRSFFRWAVALGADPATWNKCQLVRMPNGTRDGNQQTVHYYNSNII